MPAAASRAPAPSSLPMAGGLPLDESVADQAAEWLTVLMSGEASDADRQRWQRWRASHPDHERAWQHIEAVAGRLKELEPRAGYAALAARAAPRSHGRRKAAHLLLWGGLAAGGGLLASRSPEWRRQMADFRTGAGERRRIALEDGSVVTLNTASAIDVRIDGRRRVVRLVAGEVFVATRHAQDGSEDARPFVVETAEGRVRALGTRFVVRQWDGRSTVAVLESAVEITPAAGGGRRILRAGERASFDRTAAGPASAASEPDSAWIRGQIVAEDMPLADFLAELGRYRPGLVRCDPAVAGLRLSGVFPVDDTGRILASLPQVLPVRVRRRTRYWITVEAAP